MTKLKWLEYSYFQIYNIDVEIIDWITDTAQDANKSAAFRWQNYKEKTLVYVKIVCLDWNKKMKKYDSK